MMNLTETQKQSIAAWLADGLKLSEIQKRLETEFGLRPTYMEVRFLLDDLKLMPKDPEPAKPAMPIDQSAGGEASVSSNVPPEDTLGQDTETAQEPGGVSVSLDHVARPGALVSGGVTFSDGQTAQWYLDQGGRLGLLPKQQGYRPSAADLQEFQMNLENALRKMGL
jgi:hypothetical protein